MNKLFTKKNPGENSYSKLSFDFANSNNACLRLEINVVWGKYLKPAVKYVLYVQKSHFEFECACFELTKVIL